MANKFAENVSIEEDPAYQDWLDAQELRDAEALESRNNNLAEKESV